MEAGLTARAEEGERHWPSFAWSWPGWEQLEREQEESRASALQEGRTPWEAPLRYLEELAIYRQIAEQAPERGVLLFHGSAVAVDGQTYLFTAKSGTGKSTHTRLWRQRFGDRALMVNDDKPLLRFTETEVLVCGTPWNGKHHLSAPVQLPLKALCVLMRSSFVTNQVRRVSAQMRGGSIRYQAQNLRHVHIPSWNSLDQADVDSLVALYHERDVSRIDSCVDRLLAKVGGKQPPRVVEQFLPFAV